MWKTKWISTDHLSQPSSSVKHLATDLCPDHSMFLISVDDKTEQHLTTVAFLSEILKLYRRVD